MKVNGRFTVSIKDKQGDPMGKYFQDKKVKSRSMRACINKG